MTRHSICCKCSESIHALSHASTSKKILRYLKATLGKGILFKKNKELNLEAYTNAYWAGSMADQTSTSMTDRMSTSDYHTFLGGNLVTKTSKKQIVVSK